MSYFVEEVLPIISIFGIISVIILGGVIDIHESTNIPNESIYCKIATHGDSSCYIKCFNPHVWYLLREMSCYWYQK